MAQYPAPPPLRLPDGTLVPQGNDGTQNWQADGTSFQAPNPNGASRYLQDQSLDAGYQSPVDGARRAAAVQDTINMQPPAFTGAATTTAATPAAGSGLMSTLSGLLGKGASAAGSVGTAIKNNPLGAVSAVMGAAGALQYATAKAPAIPGRPDVYAPTIRPAQGLNNSSLEAARRGVQSAQMQTSRAVGADTGTTSATRLLAQQQAGEQQSALSMKDNEAFQQDQRRVDEQSNAAYDANYKTQRSYEEKRYDLQQRQFEARRQQGAAMSQAALTYFTQDRANTLNNNQLGQDGKNRQNESQLQQYRALPWATMSPDNRATSLAELDRLDSTGQARRIIERTYPAMHAKGGVLAAVTVPAPVGVRTTTTSRSSRSTSGRPVDSSAAHNAATKEFAQQMEHITTQAMQAFHTSLLSASDKRAKGLSGK